jgi:hypothetical protein
LSKCRFQRRSPTQAAPRTRAREIGLAREHVEQIGGVLRRLGADHHRQPGETGDIHIADQMAVAVDQRKVPLCCQIAAGNPR